MANKNKKGVLEISFGWIFALIAGAVILFLAIFLASRLIHSGQETVNAETGTEIGVLLNPLETGFESSQTMSIIIPSETRIHNSCGDFGGNFGEQIIQLDQKSFGKWSETDIDVSFNNKYIFSEPEIEGKKFYIFSKPFYFPFKIADLIYMSSANDVYCFENAPNDVEKELEGLNQSNLILDDCSEEDIVVCFRGNCDISVDYDAGIVEKDGKEMYFTGIGEDPRALMYGAIFSDKDTYECQIKRLMMRLEKISFLYVGKANLNSEEGCEENIGDDLEQLGEMADEFESSEDIAVLKEKADLIDEANKWADCMLY